MVGNPRDLGGQAGDVGAWHLDAFGWSEKSKGAWHLGDETWEFSGFAELLDREVRLWGWLGDEFGGWEPDGFSLGKSPGGAVVWRGWRRENVSVTFFGGGAGMAADSLFLT